MKCFIGIKAAVTNCSVGERRCRRNFPIGELSVGVVSVDEFSVDNLPPTQLIDPKLKGRHNYYSGRLHHVTTQNSEFTVYTLANHFLCILCVYVIDTLLWCNLIELLCFRMSEDASWLILRELPKDTWPELLLLSKCFREASRERSWTTWLAGLSGYEEVFYYNKALKLHFNLCLPHPKLPVRYLMQMLHFCHATSPVAS